MRIDSADELTLVDVFAPSGQRTEIAADLLVSPTPKSNADVDCERYPPPACTSAHCLGPPSTVSESRAPTADGFPGSPRSLTPRIRCCVRTWFRNAVVSPWLT